MAGRQAGWLRCEYNRQQTNEAQLNKFSFWVCVSEMSVENAGLTNSLGSYQEVTSSSGYAKNKNI